MAVFIISLGKDQKAENKISIANSMQLEIKNAAGEIINASNNKISFFSQAPVISSNGELNNHLNFDRELEQVIENSENDFSAFELINDESDFRLTLSSARFTRSRIYFIIGKDSFTFSDDLRELLHYSSKKINKTATYSIIKYGETPELITIIEDIQAIPVGHLLKLDSKALLKIISTRNISSDLFQSYFKIQFCKGSPDIERTHRLLDDNFSFIASSNPLVPISGGVDSSLINFLVNKHSVNSYPAFFLQFGKNDPELEFAKWAVKNTKAELHPIEMNPADFIRAFKFQTTKLVSPIGESSAIAMAKFFMMDQFSEYTLIDGTLADGCYGSTNYNINIFEKIKSKPYWVQRISEFIAAFLQYNEIKGNEKFHPRDSLMNDVFVKFLDIYIGPFANTLFKDAEKYNKDLLPFWKTYYNLLEKGEKNGDHWAKYTIFKMVNYACKNNTAKTYDNARPKNQSYYPFTWKSVLKDQANYSWTDKTKDNITKYPLKSILSNYIDKDFIFRKKMGLNSSFEEWIHEDENKFFLLSLLKKQGGITEAMIGRNNQKKLTEKFQNNSTHPNLSRLIISLCLIQDWTDYHKLTLE